MLRLNSYDFDEDFTFVRERLDEVGGKEGKVFSITGFILGKGSVKEIGDELDRILDQVSGANGKAKLSLLEGREYEVTRTEFVRRIARAELVG